MPETDGMTVEDLRASAEHLRAVLEAIESGTLEASGRQRAFIAGAVYSMDLVAEIGVLDTRPQRIDRF